MFRSADSSTALRLFLLLFLVFAFFAHGYVGNTDAEVEMQTTRAIVRRGSAGLSAEHPDASAAERLICEGKRNGQAVPVVKGLDGAYYSWFGVGHALTMIPFWVVGQGLALLFPASEARARPPGMGPALAEDFFARVFVSFHSPLFGALTAVVLFVLLGHLGFATRDRVVAVLLATLTTQFAPGTRESMSDITAGFFLLFALERALSSRVGGGNGRLVAAGALAGMAVLSRVTHALPVVGIFAWLVFRSLRTHGPRPILAFVLGGLPFAVGFLWFNAVRFGSPLATGYHNLEDFWGFNFFYGFFLLGLSPGKGVLLFSPLLWLVPIGIRRLGREHLPDVALAVFFLLGPWIMTSFTAGWHSSWAWGCRYLTTGTVLVVAIAAAALLRHSRTSSRRPYLLWGLGGLGLAFTVGGWLAPYHGFYDLGFRAVAAKWPTVDQGHLIHYLVADLRMSPLFGHWLYAGHAWTGSIPEGGAEVFRSLFGVAVDQPARPQWVADIGFRHLWWIGLGTWLQSVVPLVLGGLNAIGMGVSAILLGRWARSR